MPLISSSPAAKLSHLRASARLDVGIAGGQIVELAPEISTPAKERHRRRRQATLSRDDRFARPLQRARPHRIGKGSPRARPRSPQAAGQCSLTCR